jgi:uncharacterized protein (DUF58 family)
MHKLFRVAALTLVLAFPSAALATTGTGTGTGLTVTVSLSPDTAANGDTVTATESVTNMSATKQNVVVSNVLIDPTGAAVTRTTRVVLKPSETFNQTATYVVDPADPPGTYTLSVTASSKTGTATATAQVTYV